MVGQNEKDAFVGRECDRREAVGGFQGRSGRRGVELVRVMRTHVKRKGKTSSFTAQMGGGKREGDEEGKHKKNWGGRTTRNMDNMVAQAAKNAMKDVFAPPR